MSRGALPKIELGDVDQQLLVRDLAYFMSELQDLRANSLIVADHQRDWCSLLAANPRACILAPRDHGKTTVVLASILWRMYQHGRDGRTGRPLSTPAGRYTVALFSATREQAAVLRATFGDLLAANPWLLERIGSAAAGGERRPILSASATRVELANGAELRIRAFRTATRGLHPDLLVLDDVLSDQNSANQSQRERSWLYFASTLLPMNPARIVVVGTAFHYQDLLHRLGPRDEATGSETTSGDPGAPVFGFAWARYRALDTESGTSLWPARHPPTELEELRASEPTIFSREYQNDPRDDASSLFPYELTQRAIDAGAELTFVPTYRRGPSELVLMGVDLAVSEAAGADFTVAIVVAFDLGTRARRVLMGYRTKGLTFGGQVDLLSELCERYGVDLAIVEDNGFQSWLFHELKERAFPTVVIGHTTGQQKTHFADGVPALKLALEHEAWVMPSGGPEALRFARSWQAELGAYGYRDGRLEGVGEHDDAVMASWFVERAVRFADQARSAQDYEIVTLEDVGIERVRIGPDY